MAHKRVRYRGPVKVIETTGQWGVYAGERIVLRDGTAVDDDLGVRVRRAFGDASPDGESFSLSDVRIKVTRAPSGARAAAAVSALAAAAIVIARLR